MPTLTAKAPSQREFMKLAATLRRLAGINLPWNEKNLALMSSRLIKLHKEGIHNYRDLVQAIDSRNMRVTHLFVSAMTTNTTFFFREAEHFEILTRLVLEKIRALPRGSDPEIRIWCTASSSGEEPYTLAMVMQELQQTCDFTFRLLATDIDYKMLATAKTGIYAEKQLQYVPTHLLGRYFTRFLEDGSSFYRVQPGLRDSIQFGRFNLLKNYPFKSKFDIIFCRNVLIYFEKETVQYVVDHLTRTLQVGGYLFLGHSEAVAGAFPGLQRSGAAVYRWEP